MATLRHLLIALALALAPFLAAAEGSAEEGPRGRRLLVLLDDLAVRSSHSAFFGSLQARGFDLDFRLADDPKLSLHRYGQYLYDGLVLFAPSTPRFGGSVDQNAVIEFIDAGHDMILAADSSASDLIRGIATECGVDFDEDPEAMVVDHINYAVTDVDGDHTLIAGDDLIQSDVILGSKKIEPWGLSIRRCLTRSRCLTSPRVLASSARSSPPPPPAGHRSSSAPPPPRGHPPSPSPPRRTPSSSTPSHRPPPRVTSSRTARPPPATPPDHLQHRRLALQRRRPAAPAPPSCSCRPHHGPDPPPTKSRRLQRARRRHRAPPPPHLLPHALPRRGKSETQGQHVRRSWEKLQFSAPSRGFGSSHRVSRAPVLFRGIGHAVNPSNSLVLKVLSASPSAYSANPKTKLASPPSLTGSAISLVSVMQARNNARVLVSGSLDLFSNRFLKSGVQKAGSKKSYERAGNEQFVTETSKWVFHERGHLKAVNVKHHKVGETNEPGMYRINDDLEYSVEIYEWSGTSWKPYVADDVQLQFFMMSPYVLTTMSTDKKGLYSTSFKVPDVYGVFQFKVEYQRLGYTGLSFTKQIPVRPYRHNEYERFITSAYPYYTASFSTMGAFFIFSFVYLYHK